LAGSTAVQIGLDVRLGQRQALRRVRWHLAPLILGTNWFVRYFYPNGSKLSTTVCEELIGTDWKCD
jgi:hypothetical protein